MKIQRYNSKSALLLMAEVILITLAILISWNHLAIAEEGPEKTPEKTLLQTSADAASTNKHTWRVHRERTEKTNFDLIYNAKHQALAQLYLNKIKQSYAFFAPFVQTFPETTTIVLRDETDLTNGYATPIPYPHIVLYPVLPNSIDSLSETSDWPLELLSHEMTHVLTFEPTRGVVSVVKSIFGTIIAPNILLPTWWKEGVAVEVETQVANGGRLRSKYQEAYLRTLSLAQRWSEKSIDRINEELPDWPRGQHPYIFGSLFFSAAVKEKGLKVFDQLVQEQAGRVPYFIDKPAYNLLGSNYKNYYNQMLSDVENRAGQQIKQIKSLAVSENILVQDEKDSKNWLLQALDYSQKQKNYFFPQFSKDGKVMAFLSYNKKDETSLGVYEVTSTPTGTVPSRRIGVTTGLIDRLQFAKDGRSIFYSKTDTTSRMELFSDLYWWDYENKKTYPLSYALRCRELQISPENDSYVCVQVSDGKTRLLKGEINLAKTQSESSGWWIFRKKEFPQPQVLFESEIQEKISFPSFLSNSEVIYSYRNLAGEEYLEKYDLNSNSRSTFLKETSQIKYPVVHQSELYFLSDENGTFNVYHYNTRSKRKEPLTNTTATYLSFAISPLDQSLWTTTLTDDGYAITTTPLTQWQETKKNQLPKFSSLFQDRYSKKSAPTTISSDPNAALTLQNEDYSSWPYLIPRYWLPFVSTSYTGYLIEVQTSAHDPLHIHNYSASANYDSYLKRGGYAFGYLNQKYGTNWGADALRYNRLFGTRELISTTDQYSLFLAPDLSSISRKMLLQLGFKYADEEIARNHTYRLGPYMLAGYVNYAQPREAISPLEGYGFSLIAENYLKKKSFLDYTLTTLTGLFFHSRWLPTDHAIAAKVSGFHIFDKISHLNGTSSQSNFLSYDSISPTFVIRGYENGKFFGRSLVSTNLEYRFPIANIYRGPGTSPLFFKRIHGAVTFDTLSVDGFGLSKDRDVYHRLTTTKRLYSYGTEAHLETTIGYVLPLTLVVGYYGGQDKRFNQEGEVNLSLLIGLSH